jgi:hypothetical protein
MRKSQLTNAHLFCRGNQQNYVLARNNLYIYLDKNDFGANALSLNPLNWSLSSGGEAVSYMNVLHS